MSSIKSIINPFPYKYWPFQKKFTWHFRRLMKEISPAAQVFNKEIKYLHENYQQVVSCTKTKICQNAKNSLLSH
jgi:hypothetical protein